MMVYGTHFENYAFVMSQPGIETNIQQFTLRVTGRCTQQCEAEQT